MDDVCLCTALCGLQCSYLRRDCRSALEWGYHIQNLYLGTYIVGYTFVLVQRQNFKLLCLHGNVVTLQWGKNAGLTETVTEYSEPINMICLFIGHIIIACTCIFQAFNNPTVRVKYTLLIFRQITFIKQGEPISDCSLSSLIRVYTVCKFTSTY